MAGLRPKLKCPADQQGCDARPAKAIVDLGSPRKAELIVVRGCRGNCTVETSMDNASWKAVGTAADRFAALSVPKTDVRYVRVSGEPLDDLAEVSVWDGPAASGAKPVLAQAAPTEVRHGPPRDAARTPGSDSRWPLAVAIAMAVLAALGTGVLLGRRRSANLARATRPGDS